MSMSLSVSGDGEGALKLFESNLAERTQRQQYKKRRRKSNRLGNAMKTACYATPYLSAVSSYSPNAKDR